MTVPDPNFEAMVRAAEPDLWLASRLVADPVGRGRLIALQALHVELSKVAGAATNPLAGEIRLAWWREEAEALEGRRALGHPALEALKGELIPAAEIQLMIDARHQELDPRPFADEAALLHYMHGAEGGLMRAGTMLLSGVSPPLTETARAAGWARLLRDRPAWRARGRDWAPLAWGEADEREVQSHVHHCIDAALKGARAEVADLPVEAFPAVAHAALASAYARGRRLSALEKRVRLVWASLRGRV